MSARLEIASRILAGFTANPAVFAHNESCGWCLVNASDSQIASYAIRLADELIEADKAILPPTPDTKTT